MAGELVKLKNLLTSYAEAMRDLGGHGAETANTIRSLYGQIDALNKRGGEAQVMGRVHFAKTRVNTFVLPGVNTVVQEASVGDSRNTVPKLQAAADQIQTAEAAILHAQTKTNDAVEAWQSAEAACRAIASKSGVATESIRSTAASL